MVVLLVKWAIAGDTGHDHPAGPGGAVSMVLGGVLHWSWMGRGNGVSALEHEWDRCGARDWYNHSIFFSHTSRMNAEKTPRQREDGSPGPDSRDDRGLPSPDRNPSKVNLGVGVYYTTRERCPARVRASGRSGAGRERRGPSYLAMDGFPEFLRSVQARSSSEPDAPDGRAGPGHYGPGRRRHRGAQVGADFIKASRRSSIYMSTRANENHRPSSSRRASGSRCTPITIRRRTESSSRR